jgi:signal peptidase II
MPLISTVWIKRNLRAFLLVVLLAVALDQISKFAVVGMLDPFDPPREIIGSLIRFKLAFNPYGVFSIQFGPPALYYILSLLGIIAFILIGLSQTRRLAVVVWGLIIGGAIGNFIDRVRMHYVVDFIDMGIGAHRWYVYNLADAFISVGVVFLLVQELFWKKPAPDNAGPERREVKP